MNIGALKQVNSEYQTIKKENLKLKSQRRVSGKAKFADWIALCSGSLSHSTRESSSSGAIQKLESSL